MGKFFNEKIKSNYGQYIRIGIICLGVILLFIIFALIIRTTGKKKVVAKDLVRVEVNSSIPDVEDFFETTGSYKPEDIELDVDNFDISQVGTQEIIATVGKQRITLNVEVYDETPPNLSLQDVIINQGETYEINDFIVSCDDNSNGECNYEYELEEYRDYEEPGIHDVAIIAYDESNNKSVTKYASLVINSTSDEPSDVPTGACSFGDMTINTLKYSYPIAVIVGNQSTNCALDINLWQDKSLQGPAITLSDNDTNKLHEQLSGILASKYPNGAKVIVQPHYIAVLNKTKTGLVGYAVLIEVFVGDATSEQGVQENLANRKLVYYLRSDGTREYTVNSYNLAQ